MQDADHIMQLAVAGSRILFRVSLTEEIELASACRYFLTHVSRCEIPDKMLVIPRYAALPFYKELEQDL